MSDSTYDHLYLPDDRYLAALERQRGRIVHGVPLRTVDSDAIGEKDTSCSWGLCSDEVEAWPDAQDHLWPDQFMSRSRVAPRYRGQGQMCPMDTRPRPNESGRGCFYSCRIFQSKRDNRPDRAEAVRLYDVELSRVRQRGAQ